MMELEFVVKIQSQVGLGRVRRGRQEVGPRGGGGGDREVERMGSRA